MPVLLPAGDVHAADVAVAQIHRAGEVERVGAARAEGANAADHPIVAARRIVHTNVGHFHAVEPVAHDARFRGSLAALDGAIRAAVAAVIDAIGISAPVATHPAR